MGFYALKSDTQFGTNQARPLEEKGLFEINFDQFTYLIVRFILVDLLNINF